MATPKSNRTASDWASPRDSGLGGVGLPARGRDAGYDEIEIMRDFPIDRYDELRANDILPLLSELDAEDLKMVREEEAAAKARTSILVPDRRAAGPRGSGGARRRPARPRRPPPRGRRRRRWPCPSPTTTA